MYYNKVNFSIICFAYVYFSSTTGKFQKNKVFQYMSKVTAFCSIDYITQSDVYEIILLPGFEQLLAFSVIAIYRVENIAVGQG